MNCQKWTKGPDTDDVQILLKTCTAELKEREMYKMTRAPARLCLRSVALAAALTALGCAATAPTPSKPLFVFPGQEEIGRLRQLPPPAKLLAEPPARADDWSFPDPPAQTLEEVPYEDLSPWGRALAALVQTRPQELHLSRGLRCQADELARFFLEKGAVPPAGLRRFITARCGSLFAEAASLSSHITAPTSVTDEELGRLVKERLAEFVAAMPPGAQHLGLSLKRRGDQALLLMLYAQPTVSIDPLLLLVPSDGKFVVSGALLTPATYIEGIANAGRFGVSHCERNRATALPRFELHCQLAAGDSMAWAQVAALPPEHVLLDGVLTLLMRRPDADLSRYAGRATGKPAVQKTAEAQDLTALRGRFLTTINDARREAGVPPLKLAEHQSQTVTDLAPQLLAAHGRGTDFKVANRIVLGLLAGWDVGGTVRGGNLITHYIAPSNDLAEWIEEALQQPHTRGVLLQREPGSIAIGPLAQPKEQVLGAVVTTHTLFHGVDHRADTDAAMGQFHQERIARRLPAPVFITELNALMDAEARAVPGGASPIDALKRMLESVAQRGFSVHGDVLQTTNLERLTFPAEALRKGRVRVGVTVTHHRPPGAAWAHYVVYLVTLDDAE